MSSWYDKIISIIQFYENSTVLSEFFCKNKLLFKQSADSGSRKIEFNFNLNKYNFYNFLKLGV